MDLASIKTSADNYNLRRPIHHREPTYHSPNFLCGSASVLTGSRGAATVILCGPPLGAFHCVPGTVASLWHSRTRRDAARCTGPFQVTPCLADTQTGRPCIYINSVLCGSNVIRYSAKYDSGLMHVMPRKAALGVTGDWWGKKYEVLPATPATLLSPGNPPTISSSSSLLLPLPTFALPPTPPPPPPQAAFEFRLHSRHIKSANAKLES